MNNTASQQLKEYLHNCQRLGQQPSIDTCMEIVRKLEAEVEYYKKLAANSSQPN